MFFSSVTRTWHVQFSSSTERLAKFRWCIAKGRHLFPFRTEQLSLSAPMVLGGQPPGRVGRRRFFVVSQPAPSRSRAARVYGRRLEPRSRGLCSGATRRPAPAAPVLPITTLATAHS